MENNNTVQQGHFSLLISLVSGSVAWIDAQSVDAGFKILSSIVSIGAGIMAIRHYYYNTKRIQNDK
jgi:hypothetical protein